MKNRMTKTTRYLLLALCLALPGSAWDFSYSATTNGAPTWNRPVQNLSGLSGIGTNVEYSVQSFVAPVTDTYTINSLATGGWDNYIFLYVGAFNAAAPFVNVIAANDDFAFIGQSRIVQALTGGLTYNVVTTGYFNNSSGAFSNTVSTPTPEPKTWLMIAFGVGVLLMRRRLSPDRCKPAAPPAAQ